MSTLVQRELARCDPSAQKAFASHLIEPRPKTLHWEYGEHEPFPSWVVADMKERDVFVAYCLGGHGALGSPWGLVFGHDEHFGMDSGWYPSLSELLTDWGMGGNA